MKVSELFEDGNPKLGYDSKKKYISRKTKEWVKSMGAEPAHLDAAIQEIKGSPEYKAVIAAGAKNNSSANHDRNGSIAFKVEIPTPRGNIATFWYILQPTGKFDVGQGKSGFHRAPGPGQKPALVLGKPVESVVKSMKQGLVEILKAIKRRKASYE